MADKSKIEWTEATWNPVTGCTKVSPGCDHCYAETFAERWRGKEGHYFERGFDVVLRPDKLTLPLRWTKPRRIFVNSMSDLFHDSVPDEYIARVFAVMAATPQHTYQLLTKRHGRMRSLLTKWAPVTGTPPWVHTGPWPLPNVWLGVSVEDQKRADLRIPALLETPAAVRWLSCEPLLGPVDLRCHACDGRAGWTGQSAMHGEQDAECGFCDGLGIYPVDWVVVGGESGPGARPMHPEWARSLRDQCQAAGVPYFFKQWGAFRPGGDPGRPADWVTASGEIEPSLAGTVHTVAMARVGKHAAGRELDGRTWDEYPTSPLAVA